MRRGIFGGTFNPPHFGHLLLSAWVVDEYQLDELRWVPAKKPPHKEPRVAIESRLEMAVLAVEILGAGVRLDDREISRAGKSFTIDTILSLQQEFPEDEWFLVVGGDQFHTFDTWQRWRDILARVHLIVVGRPDAEGVPDWFSVPYRDRVFFSDMPPIGISSEMIRRRFRADQAVRFLLPSPLEKLIRNQGLYGK